jgi:hypothetical protein
MKRTSSFLPAVATTWLCFAAIDAQSQEEWPTRSWFVLPDEFPNSESSRVR